MALRPFRLLALGALAVGVAATAGCSPAHLDSQEQAAFARECASLLERNLANDADQSTRSLTLDGQHLDLNAGSAFYDELQKLRGPDTFDLHDPASSNSTRNTVFDLCRDAARRRPSITTTPTTPN
jgi:hypothetical protein